MPPNEGDQVMWCGDFNRHHPLWDRDEDEHLFTAQATREAEVLISMLADNDMKMALPKGIPTLQHMVTGRYSRPDNVWCTPGLYEQIIQCDVDSYLRPPCTDHLPIVTIIDVPQERVETTPSYNFRMADWDAFRKELTQRLGEAPEPTDLLTDDDLQAAAETLTNVLQQTIKTTIKVNKPCPHTKRWWNSDLQEMKMKVNKLSRKSTRYRALPDHVVHTEYRDLSNKYGSAILDAKRQHWTDFLEDATADDMWTANRYFKDPVGDGGKTRIPTLKTETRGRTEEHASNDEKARVLAASFFPPPPAASSVPEGFQYPTPHPMPETITMDQIQRQVKRLSPYKACGPDGIPNVALQRSLDIIGQHLLRIYQAVFKLKSYVDSWREFLTVVLRKPGKPNYQVPKAYRPIALLCTMAKILTAIVAETLSRMIEKEQLLPTNHYGGRAGRMTTDAVHVLEERIRAAWRKGKVVSVLFLDVEGAFPNAVTDRLLHNLRKRRIPTEYVKFIENLLKDRRTKLKFDDFISALIKICNGIGQGDPLSMVLYIIYNADLLEIAGNINEDSLGFVDDALAISIENTFDDTTKALADFMNREDGGFKWGRDHNSKFEIDKLAVCHFTLKKIADPANPRKRIPPPHPPLILQGKTIKAATNYKYLGIHIDNQLRWNVQSQKTKAKSLSWILMFRRLQKTATGISPKLMRQLYLAVAGPKMTYGLDVWYTPPFKEEGKRRNTGSVKALAEFRKIQRIATLAITGALRTTPNDLLDAHAGVLPVDLLLKKICHRSLVRACTLPETNPLSLIVQIHHDRPTKRHVSALQQHMKIFKINPNTMEKITPTMTPPTYRPQFETEIASSKEEAIEIEAADDAEIKIYTDGSCHEGKVGAAAVLYLKGRTEPSRTLYYHLGADTEYGSKEAEAVGCILGVWLLRGSNHVGRLPISLYTDSQAFIRQTTSRTPKSGSYLQDKFIRLTETVAEDVAPCEGCLKFKLRWIAAHKDVKGNERADTEAKRAARGRTTPSQWLPSTLQGRLAVSADATKKNYMEALRAEWTEQWSKSPRKQRLDAIDPDFPFDEYRQLQGKLTRAQASLLIQIRSGHIPLNAYLFRFGKSDTKRCNACWRRSGGHLDVAETVRHFLFECPSYQWERSEMDEEIGPTNTNLRAILKSKKSVEALLKFVSKTRRLRTKPGEVPREIPNEVIEQ
ncbi:hypothetical protein NLJ89_g11157 [Agrocybe chaxingu]|uniref:Reverse transcriptase n=1 Tax=Agrocybe chaxingu TaxID=84603 RepID=A0A9W8MPL8_9AGAR|nr:hypothetical protein NLJ89_g11157 [Agrocybe chaxingu]